MNMVSIVIPTRDRAALLAETLASVRAQTWPGWEAIVIDDGSSDETMEMVRAMANEDSRVRCLARERAPEGAPTCRNLGIAAAQGEWVLLLDSDDLLPADSLERRLAETADEDAAFFVSVGEFFFQKPGDSGQTYQLVSSEDDLDRFLRIDNPWQTSGPIWRREALRGSGGFVEGLPSWQDWELHVRVLARGVRYKKCKHIGYYQRFHAPGAGNITSKQWWTAEHLEAAEKTFLKVRDELARGGRLTSLRQRRIAGLLMHTAESWANLGNYQRARETWKKAVEAGGLSRQEDWTGRIFFAIRRFRYVRHPFRRYLLPSWKRRKGLNLGV